MHKFLQCFLKSTLLGPVLVASVMATPAAAEQEIHLPAELKQGLSFEPSGLTYLQDIQRFLVVSDDTDDDKTPLLFLMDRSGKVEQTLLVPDLKKISDLESISQSANGDTIYLMTSQSLNKDGENKKIRNQFVRVRRSGRHLYQTESVNFKEALIKAIKHSGHANLQAMFPDIDQGDIEIESHFVDGDDLYIGFKKPQKQIRENIILLIKDFGTLFTEAKIGHDRLELWQAVDFGAVKGAPHRLSDLTKIKGEIFAATVCEDETCGAVWKLQEVGGKLRPVLLREFEGLKPEGISFDPEDSSLMVVFDEKAKPGKFTRIVF